MNRDANKIEHLDTTLSNLDDTLKRMKELDEKPRRRSRLAVTAALAIAGSKLTGVFGAKLGVLYSVLTDKKGWPSFKLKDMPSEAERGWRFTRHAGIGAAVTAVLGSALFGTFGWLRSDRIKDPDDLIRKPFDSISRLFGAKQPETALDKKPASAVPIAAVVEAESPILKPEVPLAEWGARVQQPAAQAELNAR